MYSDYQPFDPMAGLLTGSRSSDSFQKLPNRGMYSITPARRQSATSPKQQPEDREYRWSAYLPWGDEERRIRPSSVSKYCRGTIDFLKDVQKYIRTIRKPLIIDHEKPIKVRKVRKRKIPAAAGSVERTEKLKSFSVKYIGNIDGKVAVVTKRAPLPPRPRPVDRTVCGLSKHSFVSEATVSTFPASEPTTPTRSPKLSPKVFSQLPQSRSPSTPKPITLHREVSLRAASIPPQSSLSFVTVVFPQTSPLY